MIQQTFLPPFSLYNIGNNYCKSCYQSPNLTIICNLTGPYFDRSKISNQPTFNCSIIGSTLEDDQVSNLSRKLKEILAVNVVDNKYLRMNFDVNFQVVEIINQDELMPALINLLCFSLMLAGVQIKSVFSCAQAWLTDDGISWQKVTQSKGEIKKMCLCLESSQKLALYTSFEGQFVFVHYQRLSNILMDANQQIHNYITKKIWQLNEQCQN